MDVNTSPLIRVSQLSKTFDGNVVLREVSLSVERGAAIAIVGRTEPADLRVPEVVD
jgi:ABC-type transporter Mla maintaining outer membrane lipid asymmetry ATPase subunit MlaF